MEAIDLKEAQKHLEEKRLALRIVEPRSSAVNLPQINCEFCGKLREYASCVGITLDILLPCDCPESVADIKAREQLQLQKEMDEQIMRQRNAFRDRVGKVMDTSQVPERFLTRTFETFDLRSVNRSVREAYEIAVTFSLPSKKGLLFISQNCGVGKTHLAAAIANRILASGQSVVFGTMPSLLSRVRDTYSNRDSESEIIGLYQRCDLLVIDDFGKERVTDWVEDRVYEIINTRYERCLPLIMTTNLGISNIEDRYPWSGKAITSRLNEMTRGVLMNGDDYRCRI